MNDTAGEIRYRFSIRRPVAVAMLFLTIMVFGWKSYQGLAINLMPDISYPTLTVRTDYEGAAPEDVVQLVTRPLEERLSVVKGVVQISSSSSAGRSEVILEFNWGTNMDLAMQDVRDSLDMFTPPQGVTKRPIILRYDPTLDPVMRVALIGDDHADLPDLDERARLEARELTLIREAAERQLKGDLEAEEGIAQVVVKGGRQEEIQVHVDAERLKNLNLTFETVVAALQQQNINLSGGSLREGGAEYLVRTLNEFQNVDEIRAVVLRNPGGRQFRLDEVADVRLGLKDRETVVRVNGREAVELEIYKEGDANTVEVCNKLKDFFNFERKQGIVERILLLAAQNAPSEQAQAIRREIERQKRLGDRLRSRLPRFAQAVLVTDQSRFIVASINEVQQTAVVGGALALIILFFFLRELRSTVIIGVAIPISVIATFVPMYARDVTLNIMSLGGLALGIGMLVDNSIVVLESIFRCREEGDGLLESAERGTHEVAGAVTASTLTTVAVFFPLVFVEGIAGQLFRDLALTVTFSLIASLLVSLYLVPMIASRGIGALGDRVEMIWALRVYREARATSGRLGAGWSVVAGAPHYALNSIQSSWADSVGGLLGTLKGGRASTRIVSLVFFPAAFLLFLIQLALKAVGAAVLTVLFGTTLVVLAVAGLATAAVRLVLWLPLTVFDRTFRAARAAYLIGLRRSLRFSPVVLLATVLLGVQAVRVAGGLGQELIPPLKQGEFTIRLEAPPGTRLDDTERRAREIEAVARSLPEVESVTVQVGAEEASADLREGENVATVTVKLRADGERVVDEEEVIEVMRRAVTARLPDPITFSLPTFFSFKKPLEIRVFGDDLGQLRRLGEAVVASVRDVPGLRDPELSLKAGYPEVHVSLDRDLLAARNIAPSYVAQLLRIEVQGDIASRYSRAGEKIDIRVRSDRERLAGLGDLRNLSITDSHPPTPLSAVANIRVQEGPSEIRRIDQRQVAIISANVEGFDLGSVARGVEERLDALSWPPGYHFALGGQQRELETSYSSLVFALALAVFLVYVVMACQFESVWHPAIIMFSVPLAFIGVVYVLDWTRTPLSVIVFIGGIVLSGIIVNVAIVLVDYINQLRARGLSKVDAIVQAAGVRFRPIMMTTLTTVLGLAPMALSRGEGAEIRSPMAITVMAGLLSGTVLTLVIIPMVYYLFGGRERA